MRFTDKVCLVIGGGCGIGQAACKRFTAEGGKVVVVDLNEAHSDVTAQAIPEAGRSGDLRPSEHGRPGRGTGGDQGRDNRWGTIDVLVNDAAMMTFTPIVDVAVADWDKGIGVNLRSVFLFCTYTRPHMLPGDAIVNIYSVHAHATNENVVPATGLTGGVEASTYGLSHELAERTIRINSVTPGAVDTPMLGNNPKVKTGAEKLQGAAGKPGDLAAAICFIAAAAARFINGTTLVIDGGRLDKL